MDRNQSQVKAERRYFERNRARVYEAQKRYRERHKLRLKIRRAALAESRATGADADQLTDAWLSGMNTQEGG